MIKLLGLRAMKRHCRETWKPLRHGETAVLPLGWRLYRSGEKIRGKRLCGCAAALNSMRATSSQPGTGSHQSRMWSDTENEGKLKTKAKTSMLQAWILQIQRFPRHAHRGLRSLENTEAGKASFPLETSFEDLSPDIAISPGTFIKALMSRATQTQRMRKLKTPTKTNGRRQPYLHS